MQLEITGLRSGYGKVQILHGVDLTVPPREITAVLGPNGAGKSTLMKTIAGHLPVMAGEIRYRGNSLVGHTALSICKEGIGFVPQDHNVFPSLTVRDNLHASSLAFEGADERVAEVIDLVASKRDGEGRWPLDTRYPGVMPVEIDEGEGRPSRWNTLRALRVLDWYSARN